MKTSEKTIILTHLKDKIGLFQKAQENGHLLHAQEIHYCIISLRRLCKDLKISTQNLWDSGSSIATLVIPTTPLKPL